LFLNLDDVQILPYPEPIEDMTSRAGLTYSNEKVGIKYPSIYSSVKETGYDVEKRVIEGQIDSSELSELILKNGFYRSSVLF
jgi:hypothetical protein